MGTSKDRERAPDQERRLKATPNTWRQWRKVPPFFPPFSHAPSPKQYHRGYTRGSSNSGCNRDPQRLKLRGRNLPLQFRELCGPKKEEPTSTAFFFLFILQSFGPRHGQTHMKCMTEWPLARGPKREDPRNCEVPGS